MKLVRPITQHKKKEIQGELERERARFSNAAQRSLHAIESDFDFKNWFRFYPLTSSIVTFYVGFNLGRRLTANRGSANPEFMLPHHLASHSAHGLATGQSVAQFEIGSVKNFVYLVIDWASSLAAVIDPQSNLTPIQQALETHDLKLSAILLTHTHPDHIAGVPELLRLYPQTPVFVHPNEQHRLERVLSQSTSAVLNSLTDGQVVKIGQLSLKTLHTPGHSAGECCFWMAPYLFTGDTLFIRDCGRTDFESGSNEEMFHSLQRIKKLPLDTVILPGHHYKDECASTLARELEESPPLHCQSVSELAALP